MEFPSISLEIQGMKQTIKSVIMQRHIEMDTYIKEALDRVCSEENIKKVIAKEVDAALGAILKDELESYYKYGDGRKYIREKLLDMLKSK